MLLQIYLGQSGMCLGDSRASLINSLTQHMSTRKLNFGGKKLLGGHFRNIKGRTNRFLLPFIFLKLSRAQRSSQTSPRFDKMKNALSHWSRRGRMSFSSTGRPVPRAGTEAATTKAGIFFLSFRADKPFLPVDTLVAAVTFVKFLSFCGCHWLCHWSQEFFPTSFVEAIQAGIFISIYNIFLNIFFMM